MRKLCVLQLINVRWYNACAFYAITQALALKKRGHRVIVGADPQSPPIQIASKLRLETYDKLWLSRVNPFTLFHNIKEIVDLVGEERVDIVNAHRAESHVLAALATNWFRKDVPIIRTRGDVRPPRNNLFNRYLNRNLTRRIITTAEILKKEYLNNFGLAENRVVKINSGIDKDYFTPQKPAPVWKKRLHIPDNCLVVGMVGRLSPVKGHGYFIRAADFVLKNFPQEVKFVVAGEDAQVKAYRLKELTEELKIRDKFSFVGKIDDVRKVISLFDVAVVASVGSETICRVALEYMAMGKPVVATNVNALPETVKNEVSGFIVLPKNGKNLGRAILELLRNESKRKAFGIASRRIAEEEFSLDRFGERSENLFYELVERR